MRFLHTGDLHIGKAVNDFSMLEDQKFILEQIAGMAKANHADLVVVAGDVYDRAIPPAEAVTLFDGFLNMLSEAGIQTLLISGNHDSPERLSFGARFLGKQGVHIGGAFQETLTRVCIPTDGFETEFVLLPFVKPAQVNVHTSEEAVKALLDRYWEEEQAEENQKEKRRVLVTHFFVTDEGKEPELSDSETTIHVGGLDNVDASVFEGFDYVALGHIHKPQQIGNHPVWYAGSPLKYSFGETEQTKSVLLVDLEKEGLREVKKLPLYPRREMRKLKGTLKELLANVGYIENSKPGAGEGQVYSFAKGSADEDYIQAILTDGGELIDPIGTLRSRYPNVMQIVREDRTSDQREQVNGERKALIKKKEPLALFEAFYREVRESELSEEGEGAVAELIKDLER